MITEDSKGLLVNDATLKCCRVDEGMGLVPSLFVFSLIESASD